MIKASKALHSSTGAFMSCRSKGEKMFLSFNMTKELQQEGGRPYLTCNKNHIQKNMKMSFHEMLFHMNISLVCPTYQCI